MTLSSDDLARFRETQELTLTQTCTIRRPSAVSDSAGGWAESASTVASNVACRLAVSQRFVLSGDLKPRRERMSAYDELVLKVKWNQDIEPNDLIDVGGETFRVEALLDEQQWVTLKRARVTRIQ